MTPQELFDGNRGLIKFAIRHTREKWAGLIEYDDVNQVALIALWDAANAYTPRGCKFSTVAGRFMRNAIVNEAIRQGAKKRGRKLYHDDLHRHVPMPHGSRESKLHETVADVSCRDPYQAARDVDRAAFVDEVLAYFRASDAVSLRQSMHAGGNSRDAIRPAVYVAINDFREFDAPSLQERFNDHVTS